MSTPQEQAKDLIAQLSAVLEALPELAPSPVAAPMIVTAVKASELTGYSEGQLKGRRQDGTHVQSVIWWHDDKGSIVYDMVELQNWMRRPTLCRKNQSTPVSKSVETAYESDSRGKVSRAPSTTTPRLRLQG